jgi:hypothetical protein
MENQERGDCVSVSQFANFLVWGAAEFHLFNVELDP